MSLEIYPSDYSTRYELTHAISVQMSVYYNDIGKLTIVAPVNDYNIMALKVGNMLYDTDRDVTYFIVNTKHDTEENRITANGYTANWLLNRRCIASQYHLTTLESGIYALVNANKRDMPRLEMAAAAGLTEATDVILSGGQLLDEIMPYLEEAGLGQKMVWDADALSHTFKIYKGADLTSGIHAVVFSEEQGTAQELVINDDDSTLKNVAYVTGHLKNDTDFVELVGTATGEERREVWLETSVSQEDDESEADCKARAVAYATMELGKRIRRKSFSVAVDSADFGTIYNMGDIVSCVSVRFGVSFNARITGVKYKMDSNSTSTEIILGDPVLTAIGELKLSGNRPERVVSYVDQTKTNLIPESKDASGAAFGTNGIKSATRLNSSGAESTSSLSAYPNAGVTGFMPITYGQTIEFENCNIPANSPTASGASVSYCAFYDENHSLITSQYLSAYYSNGYLTLDENNHAKLLNTVAKTSPYDLTNAKYFRVSSCDFSGDSAIYAE